jgi:hypothetical protein
MVRLVDESQACAYDIVNGRDKVICVNKLEANEVQKKVGPPLCRFCSGHS